MSSINKGYMVWQEVFDNGVKVRGGGMACIEIVDGDARSQNPQL